MEDPGHQGPHIGKTKENPSGLYDAPVKTGISVSNSLSCLDRDVIVSVLDNVGSLVHVADMNTRDILFVNRYGREIWGDVAGQKCWTVIHDGRTGPCPECVNVRFLDKTGAPNGTHSWEYFNTRTGRWYDCLGRAMRLPDGRIIAVKVATDITERKKAEEEQSRYLKRLEKIRDIDSDILTNGAPGDIARKALKHLKDLVPGERASIFSFDADANICTILAVEGDVGTDLPEGSTLGLDDVLGAEDFMEGHVTVRQDIAADGQGTKIERIMLREGYGSYLRVPMWIDSKLTGSLNISSKRSRFFTEDHVEIAREVATTLALAIRQAQMHQRIEGHSRQLQRKVEDRTRELELLNRALISDIGERKQVMEQLRESEERYRVAIESSNDGVAIIKGDHVVFTNRKYNEIFGYTDPRGILGKDMSLTVHPDDAAWVTERNARRQRGEDVPTKYECRGFKKDGTTICVEVSATSVNYRGEAATLAYIRDITKRKEAEERLKENERRYRDLVENSLVGIYQTDLEGNIIYINDAFVKMLGFDSPDEMRREKAFRYYADPVARREFLKTLTDTKKVPSIELELLTKSGERKSILLSATLEGNRLSGMAKDITERKKAELELKEKSQVIEEANAALKALLKQRERDRDDMEQKVLGNLKQLVLPYLDKLRPIQSTERQRAYLDIIESNIRDIISPFLQRMTSVNLSFTPTEIKVAAFIRDGKTMKEISRILGVSQSAVNLHRQHIRNKLALNGKKINLRTFLMSLK